MSEAARTHDDAERRPAWTLRRRLAQTFLVLGVLLAVFIAGAVVAIVLFVRAGNSVIYQWEPTRLGTQAVLTDLIDQETGIRGYALSGDPRFLDPYRTYRAQQTSDLARLRSLLRDEPDLLQRVDALEQSADVWRTTIAQPSIARLSGNSFDATTIIESIVAKQRFDRIRARAAQLESAVTERTADARVARRDDGIGVIVALSLALLALLAAGWVLWRGLHRWVLGPTDRLALQTRAVASGERDRSIVADGPLELRELGGDVEAMRGQIVSELARAEVIAGQLQVRSDELARSNEDLQQFAYVASHDLSEPLRKVANFCQLLERQYGPQLDDRARQYIDFAVDGAKRMQSLITDLLSLSRVGRTTEEFVPVDLQKVLDTTRATFADRLVDAGGTLELAGLLPTVQGDRALLTSLFQNLVGNAVKYRRDDAAPVVRIAAEHDAPSRMWRFTVADNGIGIDPQYADRIFVVFQRLHLRDQYGGTGIGLAMCRRIVEFHGGRIRLAHVQSPPGATFEFTLPEGDPNAQSRD